MYKFKNLSIKVKTVLVVVFSLIVGSIIYLAVFSIGDHILTNYYLTPERETTIITDFQKYVSDNNLSSVQSNEIQKWCKQKKNVYCMIFNDDSFNTLIDSKNIFNYQDSEIVVAELYANSKIRFSDTECKVAIIEYSEDVAKTILTVVAFAFASVVVLFNIVYYLTKLTNIITSLSKQAKEVSNNVNHKIILDDDANDEIGELYHSIEKMRSDIVIHFEKEQEVINANRELITNMSHDIRTPLTSIIGYNEMMLNPDSTELELRQYAKLAFEKANQLKSMSDKLFKYSLVYNKDEIEVHKEKVDAELLLQQLIGEQVIIATKNGFNIKFTCEIENVEISTDVMLLKQVLDNIFSNIQKYADKSKTVLIKADVTNSHVQILFLNYTVPNAKKRESTLVGNKSCEKIMSELGGKIEFKANDDVYITTIII